MSSSDIKVKSALVLDDSKDIVENIRDILKQEKFKVIVAYDGRDGAFKCSNEKFDVIVTDINMPKLSGIEFIKQIRETESKNKQIDPTPIIVMSGSIDDFKREIQMMDKVGCIEKPFTGQELIDKVNEYLSPKSNKTVVNANKIQLNPGDYLIKEGRHENEMFWVVSGKFVVTKLREDGSELVIGEIATGELVGEMSFLDDQPRSASVRAMEPSEVISIPNSKFIEVLDKQPRWFQTLIRTLSRRLRVANEKLGKKSGT
jgi:CRP/FNR family cyclic AMP-dependent transcriptional regulator